MKIKRERRITREDFVSNYLESKEPVIVEEVYDSESLKVFSPESLIDLFGEYELQIYNELFNLQTIQSIGEYIQENFNDSNDQRTNYLRGYTQFKDVDFFWADELFNALKDKWKQPEFLPVNNLLVPFSGPGDELCASDHNFPYKGLFISGKGAQTKLHRDPLMSNAVLCQFYGQKKITLYSPAQEKALKASGLLANPDNVNGDNIDFQNVIPDYTDVLNPGEIVLFPEGWYHQVESVSDSISVTWNFVLNSDNERFSRFLQHQASSEELEVYDFFKPKQI